MDIARQPRLVLAFDLDAMHLEVKLAGGNLHHAGQRTACGAGGRNRHHLLRQGLPRAGIGGQWLACLLRQHLQRGRQARHAGPRTQAQNGAVAVRLQRHLQFRSAVDDARLVAPALPQIEIALARLVRQAQYRLADLPVSAVDDGPERAVAERKALEYTP
jgi:hypothetical protein